MKPPTLGRRRSRAAFGLVVCCIAFACDKVLGIEPTFESGPDAGRGGFGGFGGGAGLAAAGDSLANGGAAGARDTSKGPTSGGEAHGGAAGVGHGDGRDGSDDGGAAGGEPMDPGAAPGGGVGGVGSAGAAATDDWSPVELPGLALWLEPSGEFAEDAEGMRAWRDRSRHGHVAFQEDPGRRPRRVLAESGSAIVFDGVDDFLMIADHESLRFGAGDFVVEVVFSHTTIVENSTSGSIVLSKQNRSAPYAGIGLFGNRPVGTSQLTDKLAVQLNIASVAVTPSGIAYNDGQLRILGLYRTEPFGFDLRVDGQRLDTTFLFGSEAAEISAPGSPVYVGGGPFPEQALRAVICEVVVASDVAEDDVARLESYLRRKYASLLDRD